MNLTQSFQEFSSKVTTMDLALYAGIGLVLWILFKDNLKGVLDPVTNLVKGLISKNNNLPSSVELPKIDPVVVPRVDSTTEPDEVFFKLIVSWKQTRDLAEKSGCVEAIKVADQMFPYLSPTVCNKESNNEQK
jgi:hypothetical protein